jgi:hypothetical protein
MVRRANDDFILSFLTLMSIFPRAYFLSPFPHPPPLSASPTSFLNLERSLGRCPLVVLQQL